MSRTHPTVRPGPQAAHRIHACMEMEGENPRSSILFPPLGRRFGPPDGTTLSTCPSCPRWRPGCGSSPVVGPRADRVRPARPYRDAEEVRPAARRARRPDVRGGGAARQEPGLPDRRRRARAARAPDERRPAPVRGTGQEGAGEADVPGGVRRRRGARADGGREEEARGRVDPHAGGARRRARPPRPRRARARRSVARRDPAGGASPAPLAPSRPARARGHRPRPRERGALGGPAAALPDLHRASDEEVERLATAIRDDLSRALELRLQGKGDAAVYRVHGHYGEPCPRCGETLLRVDFEEHTITYCAACQTGGRILKDRRLSRLLR